jgi:hypothetical protein
MPHRGPSVGPIRARRALTAGPNTIVDPSVNLALTPADRSRFGQPNALREVAGFFEAPDGGIGQSGLRPDCGPADDVLGHDASLPRRNDVGRVALEKWKRHWCKTARTSDLFRSLVRNDPHQLTGGQKSGRPALPMRALAPYSSQVEAEPGAAAHPACARRRHWHPPAPARPFLDQARATDLSCAPA